MFEEFNTVALNCSEINDDFMSKWHIELDEDEIDTWEQAFKMNDQKFVDMLTEDFDECVVNKFFELACDNNIFPADNSHDDEGNITKEYKTLIIKMYDTYFD